MVVAVAGSNASVFDPSNPLNATGGITTTMLSPAIAETTDAVDIDVRPTGCSTATSRCANRGTMTLTFSTPVRDPVIHISGLGANRAGTTLFNTALVMTAWTAPAKPTLSVTNGNSNFIVSGDEIRVSTVNGQPSCTTTNRAGCGSVRMTGTVTSVTFQLDLLMAGSGTATNADGWTITASLDEDFGDAPASFDPTAAASHIVGGYYLGAGVTVENAGVTNVLGTPITPSPIANATASSDANDDGATFGTLVRGLASTIDVAVTGSGGRLQGWIDWAGDGSFATAGDQIATNVTDGGAGDADGLVNGVIRLSVTPPSGTTQNTRFARFRWSPTSSVGPTGRATVGEVEDYQVIIYPQRADLSLSKIVSNSSPTNGGTITYTLTTTSAASPASTATATGITVQDTLPAGFSFVSASGTGTYNSGTGVWSVGSLAPGGTASIDITGTVTATSGTVTNIAQVSASSLADPDSTPNNGATAEDDYASVAFTVATAMAAPSCPVGTTQQIISNGTFASGTGPSWPNWTATAVWTGTGVAAVSNDTTSGTLTQSGLSGLKFGPGAGGSAVIQLSQWWRNGAPAASSTSAQLTVSVAGTDYARITTPAGGGTSATVTYLNGASGNLSTITEFTNTGWRINLPTTVSATGALTFTHSPGGSTSDDFEIDNVTLYTCQPGELTVTKVSSVLSDGVSTSNPKAIPGAVIRYCIFVVNTGPVTASNVSATDNLPADVSFVPGSLASGANCAGLLTAEDDDNSGPDESDPIGMSISGTTVTATTATLAVGASFAMVLHAIVD
ncbi:MAG: GEVED domain-containing protein [Sphingorhabdus sp.]